MGISDMFLYPSCRHARKHHSKCHESGSDGIVGSFVLTLRNINQVKHVSGKAEAILILFLWAQLAISIVFSGVVAAIHTYNRSGILMANAMGNIHFLKPSRETRKPLIIPPSSKATTPMVP